MTDDKKPKCTIKMQVLTDGLPRSSTALSAVCTGVHKALGPGAGARLPAPACAHGTTIFPGPEPSPGPTTQSVAKSSGSSTLHRSPSTEATACPHPRPTGPPIWTLRQESHAVLASLSRCSALTGSYLRFEGSLATLQHQEVTSTASQQPRGAHVSPWLLQLPLTASLLVV